MRHTIIIASMLLGMSGAIALAHPNTDPDATRVFVQIAH